MNRGSALSPSVSFLTIALMDLASDMGAFGELAALVGDMRISGLVIGRLEMMHNRDGKMRQKREKSRDESSCFW